MHTSTMLASERVGVNDPSPKKDELSLGSVPPTQPGPLLIFVADAGSASLASRPAFVGKRGFGKRE